MFVLLKQTENGDEVITFVDVGGPELDAKVKENPGCTVWMAKHWADQSGQAISEARAMLKQTGLEATFFDDLILLAVVELLEFRLRYGKAPSEILQGTRSWWRRLLRLPPKHRLDKPLCAKCRLDEGHHALSTVTCDGYQRPAPPPLPYAAPKPSR